MLVNILQRSLDNLRQTHINVVGYGNGGQLFSIIAIIDLTSANYQIVTVLLSPLHIKQFSKITTQTPTYPGRRWFQNCLNQEFYGQNLKFEVPENGLQKSIIYVFVMKKMQKKIPKTLDP